MVQIVEGVEPNRVAEIFVNKTIFITGGSGFLGKVLIEKLLRSCSDLKKIYVLIREKKGKSAQERLQAIFDGPLFDLVKKQQGKCIFDKVEAIPGDVESPDLGLSPKDRKKVSEETEIIYHAAATVQFDEPFKKAVLLNVRGTKLMLELAKECQNLLVFCHLSTAYCHEEEEVLEEKTYQIPVDPHRVIGLCEWLDEKTLTVIAGLIRGSSANTYSFTKALGERLVNEQMDKLPVVIERPSAVVPIWKEPLPGWTDNLNGPTGLLLGAGKGVIRTMYGRPDYFADFISVDCVAHALIASAYDYITDGTRRVYNITASEKLRVTFQEILDLGRNIVYNKVPLGWGLWYPGGSLTSSRVQHTFNLVLFQLLPAFLIDTILFALGVKPFMMHIQRRILRGYEIFEYYANRKWYFRNNNSLDALTQLNSTERKVFKLDDEGLDLDEYFTNCTLGARRYLLKEKDEDLPKAMRSLKMLWLIDRTVKFLFAAGVLYWLYQKIVAPFL